MRKTMTFILMAATAVLSVSAYAAPVSNAELRKDKEEARVTVEEDLNGVKTVSLGDIVVSNPRLEHSGDFVKVEMDLDLSNLKVRQNRAVLITPHVLGPVDTIDLTSIGIYGRRRYFYYERKKHGYITNNEQSYRVRRKPRKPDFIEYSDAVDYVSAVGEGELKLHVRRGLYGCCGRLRDEADAPLLAEMPAYYPELVYMVPEVKAVKERSLSGSANIEFVVNKTDIRPDYRNNVPELRKITGLIDTTLTDTDLTIERLYLKGYASPEGKYAHNADLAKGRVASLKNYVQRLYGLPDGTVETDYEPEDWEGLRKYVDESHLTHRDAILELIDSDMEIDAKEWRIHIGYPDDYKFLLDNVYPTLRHTYYEVTYMIREYTDIEDIKRVYETEPGRLNLTELFMLAQHYGQGSEEFEKVFETAVALYPDDPVAALNAANACMKGFNFTKAATYLEKAGDSPWAEYARGVCGYWNGEYDTALDHFRAAQEGGIEQAAEVIAFLENADRETVDSARKVVLSHSETYPVHEARLAEMEAAEAEEAEEAEAEAEEETEMEAEEAEEEEAAEAVNTEETEEYENDN